MVTKERLQELISLCKTIYTPDKLWGTIGNIKLNKSFTINNDRLQATIKYEDMPTARGHMSVPLEELYEKKKDAEFIVKMHTQRTEFFEPKIYENLDEWDTYHFTEPKLKCRGSLSVTPNTIIVVSGYKGYCETHKSFGDRTKDNYIKACEYARNLFLGKENENETNSDR